MADDEHDEEQHIFGEQSPLLATRPDVPMFEVPVAATEESGITVNRNRRPVSGPRAFSVILSVGTLVFMQTANISLVSTIQSSIAADLDSYTQVSWFTSAYMIAMSSVPAIAGRLCELFGSQVYILLSSIIFASGVLIASTASSFNWFLVGRAISGLGTAGNSPVAMIIIIELTSVKRRGLYIGLLNTGFTVGLALGAVIAGALEPAVGWRAVFWLQIPLILAAGLGLYFAMPHSNEAEKDVTNRVSVSRKLGSVDYLGVISLVSSVVLLLFSLASPKIVIEPIVISLVFLVAFLVIEARYAGTPIIPMSVLQSRGTLLSSFAALGMMASRYLIILYTPIYFMTVHGWPPVHAGLALIAVNGGFAVGGLLVGWIHIRRAGSYYLACIITFVLFTTVFFLTSAMSNHATPIPLYLVLLFINGATTGASLNYTLSHLLHLTPVSYHFIATSVTAMFRGLGGSFGSAIGGGIFARLLKSALERGFDGRRMVRDENLIRQLMGSPRLVAKLTGAEKVIATDAYTVAIQGLFFAGALLAVVATILQSGAGWKAPLPEKDQCRDIDANGTG